MPIPLLQDTYFTHLGPKAQSAVFRITYRQNMGTRYDGADRGSQSVILHTYTKYDTHTTVNALPVLQEVPSLLAYARQG
jgi:hypothetical protein